MSRVATLGSSFRDPSGFVFLRDGELLRQVNAPYEEHYRALRESGLYDELVSAGLLIPSEEVDLRLAADENAIAVLRPERIPFISYPYEWAFSQLKDAALATLEIFERAWEKGMVLKDASAFNIQFLRGKPVLMDTLSFEKYREGEPWVAYRQFCQHFLAPLALISMVDARLGSMLRSNLDGIPLDLTCRLLPNSARFKAGILTHIFMHAKAQSGAGAESSQGKTARMGAFAVQALVANLKATIKPLQYKPEGTVWGDYYEHTNYSGEAMDSKHAMVRSFLESVDPKPATCWDLGANTGEFSRIAASMGIQTVAWDVDPAAVEKAYLDVRERREELLLPLRQDLTNPSPDLGWASHERDSLTARGPVDVLMALALVHHLAIGNNVPLSWVCEFLASLGKWAIVEFVPKEDSQVQRMLAGRKDVFPDYHECGFEAAVREHFEIVRQEKIPHTVRTLYLLKLK